MMQTNRLFGWGPTFNRKSTVTAVLLHLKLHHLRPRPFIYKDDHGIATRRSAREGPWSFVVRLVPERLALGGPRKVDGPSPPVVAGLPALANLQADRIAHELRRQHERLSTLFTLYVVCL